MRGPAGARRRPILRGLTTWTPQQLAGLSRALSGAQAWPTSKARPDEASRMILIFPDALGSSAEGEPRRGTLENPGQISIVLICGDNAEIGLRALADGRFAEFIPDCADQGRLGHRSSKGKLLICSAIAFTSTVLLSVCDFLALASAASAASTSRNTG